MINPNKKVLIIYTLIALLVIIRIPSSKANPLSSNFGVNIASNNQIRNLRLQHRWVYVGTNLHKAEQVNEISNIVMRASKHGFNGILLSAGLDKLDLQPSIYFDHLKEIKKICDTYRFDIIPLIFSVGYGSSILSHNKNLAVGFPVKDMRFRVIETSNNDNLFFNGSFENYINNRAYDYEFQDLPSKITFIDHRYAHSGNVSLRFQNFSLNTNGNGRICQKIHVKPQTKYKLSCWIKTNRLIPVGNLMIQVYSNKNKKIAESKIDIGSCSNWKKALINFNSRNSSEIQVYIGIWKGLSGKFWIDSIKLLPLHLGKSSRNKLIALSEEKTQEINNGSFELYKENIAKYFRLQDSPGRISFIDHKEYYKGKASLRFENFNSKNKKGRISQEIKVTPYRQYALSCWIKTKDFKSNGTISLQVYSQKSRIIGLKDIAIQRSSGWHKVNVCFNSMNNKKICFYIGTWSGISGKLWIDDIVLRKISLLNIIRRDGTPLKIRNALTGKIYIEGKDYMPVVDYKIDFKTDHTPPEINICPNSKIKDGDKLLVSYFHGLSFGKNQVSVNMSEPKLYFIWKKEIKLINKLLQPRYYFLGMDEIRQGGTDEADKKRRISMAEILGDCITKQYNIIKNTNSSAKIFIWADMLNPYHNAKNNYAQIEGNLSGSWKFIPHDINIVCWGYDQRKLSLDHFKQHGFHTLIATYYDDRSLCKSRNWMSVMADYDNIIGIIYTTWKNDYTKLEDFGDLISRSCIK